MFTLIRQWQRSGISQKDFCEKKDIAYATFHYWYRKFRDVDPPDKVVSSFVPLSIPATTLYGSVTGGCEYRFSCSCSARVFEPVRKIRCCIYPASAGIFFMKVTQICAKALTGSVVWCRQQCAGRSRWVMFSFLSTDPPHTSSSCNGKATALHCITKD
jgi:hypothetical protein